MTFALVYMALAVVVFALTAITTKPSNVGLDWIPFMLLTLPWSRLAPVAAYPGIIANAVIVYLFGTLIGVIFTRRSRSKHSD